MVARFFLHQKGGKYTKFTSQSDCTITTNPAVIVRYFFFYLLVKTITLYPRGIQFYNCNPILQLQSNFTIAIQFYNCNPILQLQYSFTIAIQFYNCYPMLLLPTIHFQDAIQFYKLYYYIRTSNNLYKVTLHTSNACHLETPYICNNEIN
jgi:hypothetical protein